MAYEIETNKEKKLNLNVHIVLTCDVSSAERTRAELQLKIRW